MTCPILVGGGCTLKLEHVVGTGVIGSQYVDHTPLTAGRPMVGETELRLTHRNSDTSSATRSPDEKTAVFAVVRGGGWVILANPNAPTRIALSRAQIAALLNDHLDQPVVIDEAYVDFGAETAIPLVASHPNLLVVRTMFKSRALAGLRVGYAIGDTALIEALSRVKDSFNSYPLGRLAQAGAIAALEDEAYFQQSRKSVIENRGRLNQGLVGLGFEILPFAADFVFACHPSHRGAALAAALREHAVLVRHFAKPRISDYLRITVGTEAQIDQLPSVLSNIL